MFKCLKFEVHNGDIVQWFMTLTFSKFVINTDVVSDVQLRIGFCLYTLTYKKY